MTALAPPPADRDARPAGRLQVGLGGLMAVVLAAALASASASELGPLLGESLPAHGLAALGAEAALAGWLAVALGRQARARLRRGGPAWGRAWRLGAAGLLVGGLAAGASLARLDASRHRPGVAAWNWATPTLILDGRLAALTGLAALGLAGVVLATTRRRARVGRRSGAIGTWASAILALAAGAAIFAASAGWLPYLVALAIEGVAYARLRPRGLLRPLPVGRCVPARFDAAAGPALTAILATALAAGAIARALRRRGGPTARDLGGVALAVAASAGASAWLVARTFPMIQPEMASGVLGFLGPWECAAVLASFGAFAAGLVAHALADPEPDDRPPARPRPLARWLAGSALGLALVATLAGCGVLIGQKYAGLPRDLLPDWLEWLAFEADPGLRSRTLSPAWAYRVALAKEAALDVRSWFPALAVPWLAWRVAALRDAPSPMDDLAGSRSLRLRFLALWPASTLLGLAALPALVAAGTVLFHAALGPVAP
jgi:hypothetical protein